MEWARPSPLVHLELRTADAGRASTFLGELLRWRFESVETAEGSYLAVDLGDSIGGGIAQEERRAAYWLPYVEVPDIAVATDRASALGAAVLVDPREGPAGWRSVVVPAAGAEVALWQPKAVSN